MQNIFRFSVVVTIIGIISIVVVWLLDLLFLPLAVLWVGPFFAAVSIISGVWAYFIGSSPEEKSRAKKLVIGTLIFYIILFGIGFYLRSALVDTLFL